MPDKPATEPLKHPDVPRNSLGCSLLAVLFLLAIVGAVGLFYSAAVTMVVVQQQRIQTYKPVQAAVVQSEVRESRGSKGKTNYHAYVKYSYNINGVTHTSDRLYPAENLPVFGDLLCGNARGYTTSSNPNNGGVGVRSILSSNMAGTLVTAYYDPADPASAFLLPTRLRFGYYVGAFGAIVLWAFLVGLVTSLPFVGSGPETPAPSPDETFVCPAKTGLRGSWLTFLSFLIFYQFAGTPLIVHRLYVGGVAAWEWALIGLLGLILYMQFQGTRNALRRYQRLEDARLSIYPGTPRVGEPAGAVFTLRARQPVHPDNVKITIACTASKGKQTDQLHNLELEFKQDRALGAGEELRVETSIDIPAGLPGINSKTRQSVSWTAKVETTFKDCPSYEAAFPLYVVEGAATASGAAQA